MADDLDDLADLFEYARCVLFDFDGPICRLFPDDRSRFVADELRDVVAYGQWDVLTEQARTDKDPHVVLRTVHRAARRDRDLKDLVVELEKRVTAGEFAAARHALGTPGARELVEHLADRDLRLVVVTNNSPRAVDQYLRSEGLRAYFESIHGRTDDPDLMKPDPDVVFRALRSLRLSAEEAVMIGDTPTDVEAAARAKVRFIGYGRNEEKRTRLEKAGATVVLGSYAPLLGATWRLAPPGSRSGSPQSRRTRTPSSDPRSDEGSRSRCGAGPCGRCPAGGHTDPRRLTCVGSWA